MALLILTGLAALVTVLWIHSLVLGFTIPDIAMWLGWRPSMDTRRGVAILTFIAGCHHLYWELRPFYLPAEMVSVAFRLSAGHNGIYDWLSYLAGVGIWFMKFGDGDDRWKRRRRKAVQAVRQLASGRLVAEAVPARH